MINSINKLMSKLADWMEIDISVGRLNNDTSGRTWFLSSVDYSKTLKLEDLREHTDRESLNSKYDSTYDEEDPKSRKGLSATKIEISAMYSFNKCFVQRYKGRMHFYRDDLSQKGKRNMRTAAQSLHLLEELRKNLEN
jgi:hypothetical protein